MLKYENDNYILYYDKLDGNNTEERQYESWMIANTEDGNINMLSLYLVKQIEGFELYTEEEFCYI